MILAHTHIATEQKIKQSTQLPRQHIYPNFNMCAIITVHLWLFFTIFYLAYICLFQDSVIDWARNHRVHHKYSETDADPHNAKRGFFFSHVGWLLCRHHPEVRQKRKCLDISDLTDDPILMFQKKYYLYLMPLICFYIPTAVPVYFWGETWFNAWYINLFRYALTLNVTWLVNSAAHLYGHKPYDK